MEFVRARRELHDGAIALVLDEVWRKGMRESAVGRSISSPSEREPIVTDGVSYRARRRAREDMVESSIGEGEQCGHAGRSRRDLFLEFADAWHFTGPCSIINELYLCLLRNATDSTTDRTT